ncbi:MAG: hypothetical protein NZO16_00080 [Deltaproteobacteria bacterium]|nr:hypothetical protein [Deltaproteobacteria bacterium]
MARRNEIDVAFTETKSTAKEGNVFMTDSCKEKALNLANEIGVKLTKEQEEALNTACKEARRNGIIKAIENAKLMAQEGRVDSTDSLIDQTLKFARESCIKLTKEQIKLKKHLMMSIKLRGKTGWMLLKEQAP